MNKFRKNTRQQILEKAVEHFSKYGYAGTNLEQIGNEMELTRGPLYYYFKNKQELYLAAAQYQMETALKRYQEIFTQNQPITMKLKEDLEYCMNHNSMIYKIGSGGKEEPVIENAAIFSQKLFQLKKEAMIQAQKQGELLGDADPDEMAGFLYVYVYGIRDFECENQRYHIVKQDFFKGATDHFISLFMARYGVK